MTFDTSSSTPSSFKQRHNNTASMMIKTTSSSTTSPTSRNNKVVVVGISRRVHSFRLFLWVVGSCSMGWMTLLILFLQQQQQQQSPSSTLSTLPTDSFHTIRINKTAARLSLLEFINTSAGQLYPPPQSPDCIYLLTTTDSSNVSSLHQLLKQNNNNNSNNNNNNSNSNNNSKVVLTLWQSMNGYWKHPVGVRRRHLTPNLKLLQDAVIELQRLVDDDALAITTNTSWMAAPEKGMIHSTNDRLKAFVTQLAQHGKTTTMTMTMPLLMIINWKPTMPLIPNTPNTSCFGSSDYDGGSNNDKVLVLRDVIPKHCCNNHHHHHYICSNHYYQTIPNAPLIRQVQAVEQAMAAAAVAAAATTIPTNGDAYCSNLMVDTTTTTTTTTTSVVIPTQDTKDPSTPSSALAFRNNKTIIGIRLPHDDSSSDGKRKNSNNINYNLQEEEFFLAWMKRLQQDDDTSIVWQVNQHEDEHDIILDLSSNWTLFCQPHVLLLKVDPPLLLDMFTSSLHQWKDVIFIPVAPSNEDTYDDLFQNSNSSRPFVEAARRAIAIWNHDLKRRRQMLERKQCWCAQNMKYQKLVHQVIYAWSQYNQWIMSFQDRNNKSNNNNNDQIWTKDFSQYAKGHFWKRPGGDSWSLPLAMVGGIKGGLRADAITQE